MPPSAARSTNHSGCQLDPGPMHRPCARSPTCRVHQKPTSGGKGNGCLLVFMAPTPCSRTMAV